MLFLRCAAVARLLSYKTGLDPFPILQRLCVDPVDAQDQIAFLAGDGAGFDDKISIVASRAMAVVAVYGACPAHERGGATGQTFCALRKIGLIQPSDSSTASMPLRISPSFSMW